MELSPASCVDRFSSHMRSAEQAEPQTTIRIGILGCGSRGLTVLERLCALAATSERRVDISVFDPHRPGPGLHSVEQPAYLMLNTVASQISMFPDQAALGGYTGRHGPDFYQWCLRFKSADRVVQPNEFLPRAWLGEYLAWTYEEVIRTLPEQVRVTHHARLVDNVEHMDLGGFILSTGAQKHQVDWLLVTVGHAETGVASDKTEGTTQRYNAYPQPHCLSGISSTAHVGIEGLGLSAMDVVAGLTVGRGGCFVEGPEGLCYRACGQEPQLYMYSRSGSPYRARPDIAPHRIGASPLIFTLSAIADLRTQHPEGLDFEMQVLPLLKAEMYAEYFAVIAMLQGESSLRIKSEVATAYWLGEIDDKTRELAQRFAVPMLSENVFDPRHLQAPVDNYPQWVRSFIQDDLNESLRGLDHSPVKAAVEVWRSCREQLRRAVDNQGLKPEAHQTFFNEYAPLVNRMVAGPQKERHQELLALADAGIVHWVHGSNVMHSADCKAVAVMTEEGEVVPLNAWVCAHGGNSNAAPPEIIRQLLGNGIIHNLGERGAGVYIDSHGKALPNLWVTGPIVEGATYYNHYVPSSGSYSRAFADADRIAREMLGMTVSA